MLAAEGKGHVYCKQRCRAATELLEEDLEEERLQQQQQQQQRIWVCSR